MIIIVILIFVCYYIIVAYIAMRKEQKDFCWRYCILKRYFDSGEWSMSKKEEKRAKKCKCPKNKENEI